MTARTKATSDVISIVQTPIDRLRPDPANPRRIEPEELDALCQSISSFGFVDPVIAIRATGMVVGGHQRLLAARRLGLSMVPVVFLDLDEEKARLLNLALNRISGSWDDLLLARLLEQLKAVPDLDVSLSGFRDDEVRRLLRSLDARQKRDQSETFDLEEALEQARSLQPVEPGQLWSLGEHRLLCGDATRPEDVDRLLAGGRAAAAFTDPPYNVALGDHGGQQSGQRRRRLRNDSLPEAEWREFCRRWAANLLGNVDGAVYVCMSSKEWPTVSAALAAAGGHWSDTLIWAKDRFVLGRADYQRQYEPIWYGWREGARRYWRGDRDQSDLWRFDRPSAADLHPTVKPLALIERAVENSTRPGDRVLDLFLGSGSTLLACERTGRLGFGLELDPLYASVALARWEHFTGARAEMVS